MMKKNITETIEIIKDDKKRPYQFDIRFLIRNKTDKKKLSNAIIRFNKYMNENNYTDVYGVITFLEQIESYAKNNNIDQNILFRYDYAGPSNLYTGKKMRDDRVAYLKLNSSKKVNCFIKQIDSYIVMKKMENC